MSRLLPFVLTPLLMMGLAPIVEAGPIVYFGSYRSLEINGTVYETTAIGTWSASGGQGLNRSQLTHIGDKRTDAAGNPYERIWGSGTLNASSQPSDLSTDLFTSFSLDSPYTIKLDTALSARNAGYAEGFLFNESTQTILAQAMVDAGVTRMRYDGILDPGMYSYFLMAQLNNTGGPDHHASFSGELVLAPFTPVPEPGTMTLFGVGLAAAAWRRRKRQSS